MRQTRTSSIARASAGSSGIARQDLGEAGRGGVRCRVQDLRPVAVLVLGDRRATRPRTPSRGPGRPRASRPAGRARARAAVSASQIGKSWMTGADAVERRPDRRHLPGEDPVGPLGPPGAARERREQRDREQQRPAHRQHRTGPGDLAGPAQPPRQPGEPGVERPERRDDQQHVHRGRGVEERAPGRRDREQQAGHEERDPAHEHHRPQRAVAGLPRQRQQAEQREIGMPSSSRTLNRLWAMPSTRISTSRAGPTAR